MVRWQTYANIAPRLQLGNFLTSPISQCLSCFGGLTYAAKRIVKPLCKR